MVFRNTAIIKCIKNEIPFIMITIINIQLYFDK